MRKFEETDFNPTWTMSLQRFNDPLLKNLWNVRGWQDHYPWTISLNVTWGIKEIGAMKINKQWKDAMRALQSLHTTIMNYAKSSTSTPTRLQIAIHDTLLNSYEKLYGKDALNTLQNTYSSHVDTLDSENWSHVPSAEASYKSTKERIQQEFAQKES